MFYYNWDNITIQFIGNNATEVNIDNIESHNIKVWEQYGTLNGTQTQSKGNFNDTLTFHNYPIDAHDFGAYNHINPNFINMNLKIKYSGANTKENNELWFIGNEFKIMDGITYTINSPNQYMVVSGGGKFISGIGSEVIFPENYKLNITGFSSIEANGTTFKSDNALVYWNSISIDHPGNSMIIGCTFLNAIIPIYITNNIQSSFNIKNNTFHNNLSRCIQADQVYYLNVIGNHFYLNNYQSQQQIYDGIVIANFANSEEDNNSAPIDGYKINIVGNDFHGGTYHILINSTELLPVYISNNNFLDCVSNLNLVNTVGNISDNMINNTLLYEESNGCINLYGGSPDFLRNIITGRNHNFNLNGYANPNFAPVQLDNQFIWVGGFNQLQSTDNYNIFAPDYGSPSYFYTDYGKNDFILENLDKYHLFGFLNTKETVYKSRGNCWYLASAGNIPMYVLWNLEQPNPQLMTLLSVGPPSDCVAWDDQNVDRIIAVRGNGIFDTVLISQSNTITPPSNDESLYALGVKSKLLKNYSSAILSIKNLINTYPDSKHLERSIYKLYECYVLSDTNHNQGWRNVIFGDMKNYLEDKIQVYQNNEKFVNVAFDLFLKCTIKKKGYQLAMDGYQFIAENSPSPTERLMASINYIDVEGLIQGSGGGQKENVDKPDELTSEQNGKPIKDILLAAYNKTKKSIAQKEKFDLRNSNDIDRTKAELKTKHKTDKVLENRAIQNISISGSLTNEERRERIQKDLMLLTTSGELTGKTIKASNIEPIKYELSQNYPNPFNPVTKINYSVAKQGLVTLIIYDILGKEIKTLVNEVKSPGAYIVDFNGSNLASGVYFYKIQSGDFMQVKRMVLIK